MRIYNTLSRKKEVFKPRHGKKVNMFVCGTTVQNYLHIGHARTYIAFDVIVNYLRYKKYKVFYLQNITDIDDKIIKQAEEENVSWKDIAEKYTKAQFEDIKALRIKSVDKYAPATEYIYAILRQVKVLVDKGYAYELDDGIYYDVSMFKGYGKLSGRTILEAEDAVTKIDEAVGKRNKADFCLWKFPKPGEPFWESNLGRGRPGWHIEDTAITETEFGPQYDLHGGARELIFPHHEAEIAQMEAASGKKPLVKYWVHTGIVNVEGKKMSKSLRNFITISDALKKWGADVLRLMLISAHYSSPIDYSERALEQAKSNLERIRTAIESAKKKVDTTKWINKFESEMDDDFNTPKTIALLLQMAGRMNKTGEDLSSAIYKIGGVLGVDFKPRKEKIPLEVKKLVREREKARKRQDFKKADEIRNKLKDIGWALEDSAEGAKVRKLF